MTTERYILVGRLTALISFLIGTILFTLYYLTSAFELLLVGYGFIALTAPLNIGVLIMIFIKAREDGEHKSQLLRTCGIMLLNIPVLLAYCWVTIILLGTMRITFTNERGVEISDLKIVGCGGGQIEKLEVGESETIWVAITGDCSIYIDYLSNGQRIEETVAGYVSSNMGQKVNHKIDGKDKDIFWN